MAERQTVTPVLSLPRGEQKTQNPQREVLGIIARNIKKRGWNLGYVSAIDSEARTIWIVDAHRGDGNRFPWAPGCESN